MSLNVSQSVSQSGAGCLQKIAALTVDLSLAGVPKSMWEPSLLAMAALQPTWLSLVYISISAVTATYGFALTARHFCQTPQKYPKSLAPSVRPLAKARCSLAPAFIRGHRPPVGFASTSMRCPRLRRGALRASPLMNTSARPAEGAGRSKAKAKAKARRPTGRPVWLVGCTPI